MNGHEESNGRGNDVISDKSEVFPTICCLYPNHPHFVIEDDDWKGGESEACEGGGRDPLEKR